VYFQVSLGWQGKFVGFYYFGFHCPTSLTVKMHVPPLILMKQVPVIRLSTAWQTLLVLGYRVLFGC
jgi:hypothetical protein